MSSNVVAFRPGIPPITKLSFVKDYWVREEGRKRGKSFRVFWNVDPSGDYCADYITGRHMAIEWLQHVQACAAVGFAASGMLGWHVHDMPPKHTGIEVGFLA
jgi:hypothetical protein